MTLHERIASALACAWNRPEADDDVCLVITDTIAKRLADEVGHKHSFNMIWFGRTPVLQVRQIVDIRIHIEWALSNGLHIVLFHDERIEE
jgi:hypothetical protein